MPPLRGLFNLPPKSLPRTERGYRTNRRGVPEGTLAYRCEYPALACGANFCRRFATL